MRPRWDTGRTEAFSDAVFSIAATLLVLEISVPESQFDHMLRAILDQWPSYLAYATSFITISGLWLVHHSILRRISSADEVFARLNLLLLMVVAFLPFPTRLVAEAINSSQAERVAVLFYGLALLAIWILIAAMWRYAAAQPDMLEAWVTEEEKNAILLATTPSAGFYLLVLVLAIIAPRVAAVGYLVVAVIAVASARGDRATSTAAG
jgi:uncharacterized membrane protein